jgi:hypothetical protein
MDDERKIFIRKRNQKTEKRRQMNLAIVGRERERMG